jgi:uncharacterized protein
MYGAVGISADRTYNADADRVPEARARGGSHGSDRTCRREDGSDPDGEALSDVEVEPWGGSPPFKGRPGPNRAGEASDDRDFERDASSVRGREVREAADDQVSPGAGGELRVFRVGGISYLRIPAEDPRRSAAFYEAVFGWSLRGYPDDPSFEDGTGHVIGHFMTDLPVAGEAGVRPYIFVELVDDTLEKVVAHGGAVVTAPYLEGDLRVATFRDPPGNVIGVWQRGSGT